MSSCKEGAACKKLTSVLHQGLSCAEVSVSESWTRAHNYVFGKETFVIIGSVFQNQALHYAKGCPKKCS